ncbi:MAG: hypothetical protein NTX73_08445 [Rhodobacterales bacterium]|nr:hypothetical protein [Rhodobacterales bacterium]
MITNIPDADGLNKQSLRSFFRAWEITLKVFEDFELTFEGEGWEEERASYERVCKEELSFVITLLAHSTELRLKALLCQISPYLLLLGVDPKSLPKSSTIDFSNLRTIDAVDLPSALAAFSPSPLNVKLSAVHAELREQRNKIYHLGASPENLNLERAVAIAVESYVALWPAESWLSNWLLDSNNNRASFFDDGRNYSAKGHVLDGFACSTKILTKGNFKKLIGIEKSKRRYICLSCTDDAWTRHDSYTEIDEHKTAYLLNDKKTLRCALCRDSFSIARTSCKEPGCKGNVIELLDDGHTSRCHTCGE